MKRFISSRNNLFVKIFLSFMCIIVLFSLFNVLLFIFFKRNLQNEIIQSNRQILINTAERYGTYFSQLQRLLVDVYSDKAVMKFSRLAQNSPDRNNIDYPQARNVTNTIRREAYKPLFYLEALVVHFEANEFALDQAGSSGAEEMFVRSYASKSYPYAFWKRQFESKGTFALLPAADFAPSTEVPGGKELLPYAFKTPGSKYQVIAFLDIAQAQRAFFGEEDSRILMILHSDGTMLYRSNDRLSAQQIPVFKENTDYVLQDDFYYFSEKDANGLTYITAVPYGSIASQIRSLTCVLLLIFMLSLTIGLTASYFFSKRIQAPVKHILSAVTGGHPAQLQSNIQEFDLIERNIRELLREKEDIQHKMHRQNTILTSYGYMSQLKSINDDISEWQEFLTFDESYTVILYELGLRAAALADLNISSDRAVQSIREHIKLITSELFPDSHTFQIEKNQILSVIKGENREALSGMLAELKQILDRDKHYCLVTCAVSSSFEHSSQLNHAYKQVQTITRHARLAEDTQIVFEPRMPTVSFSLSPVQEQELGAAFYNGNAEDAWSILERSLDEMYNNEATISQFHHFSDIVTSKIQQSLKLHKVDASTSWLLKPMLHQLKACYTLEEYKEVFSRLIMDAASLIQEKKVDVTTDPVIMRVMELIETQYAEELSLDYLSGKLNMSSPYLSVYIKEKTGTNFSEHLNRIRMHKAQELLSGTSLNINDISKQIGYPNITSFNRVFKKWTGFTPGEYRKRHVSAG
ncbi:helix-turn-helix domain-containing protein [Paenibacillus sp. sptzw28]|uniref:helix-turn-helix domain-containing protein n=1 Tax=Paenibacillus sp. sptzw28 TaxID=715179 RepID=UPI001C6F4FED|nr:helix-turn-helix domain-containing protein [Paenibacillus sp. sptzw28]QYR21504.1 helix-turn-helix domain-containing protein [Paenibacillus sp. sptzw28]